jgi:hypothetical protein
VPDGRDLINPFAPRDTVEGKVIGIPTTQVRASGRATQGVRIINLEEAKVRES